MKQEIYDLIILGAGSAGLSAGIYAGRAKLKTLIIDKNAPGGQILNTNEVVNYPGIISTNGPDLIASMKQQAINFNCEIIHEEIIDVVLNRQIKEIKTADKTYQALALIIATGAMPRKLNFPGEEEFTGRGIAYCATCDGQFFTDLDIFVVGGGYAACEEAMYLTRFGKSVTMIVREEDFTCAKTIGDKVRAHPKITVHFNSEVVCVEGDDFVHTLTYIDNQTKEKTVYTPENNDAFGLFIFAGYLPATSLFKGKIDLDAHGYVKTNEQLETNIEGVYAAGDLRIKELRQIVTAVSDGAIAATNCEHYLAKLKEEHPQYNAIEPKVVQKKESGNQSDLINQDLAKQLQAVFTKFKDPVTLELYLDDSDKSTELEDYMDNIADLSDKVMIEKQHVSLSEMPVVKFKGHPISWHGIPAGHEFNPFILTMYYISTHQVPLEEVQKENIMKIDHDVHIKVGVTLACHFCPDIVGNIEKMALVNPKIKVDVYDISLFPEFKKKYRLMSVPAVIFNDQDILFGSQSIDTLIGKTKEA